MEVREAIRLALTTLWHNRLRSFLTVLGNVVAVLSVITVVAVIQGVNKYVAQEFLSTGSHVFTLTKIGLAMNYEDYLGALKRRNLSIEDADALQRNLTLSSTVVPRLYAQRSVKRGRIEAEDAPILGLGANYPLVGDYPLLEGRDLTDADIQGRAAVAVIGSRIRDKLFGDQNPIGEDVRIGGYRFTVVGTLQSRGGGAGGSRDDQVLVPVTTLARQFRGRSESVDIIVLPRDPQQMEAAQDEAALQLKIRRGLNPWDKPDFDVLSDEQLYGLYQNATKGIFVLLVSVVSLSLVIGGIVIMNIMLVSVTERTREIGIRKAVGARRRDVVVQFLVESVVLATTGGVIGVLGGIAGALIVRAASPLPASIELWSVLVGLLLASSVGLFFGIYPAWRASRLAPIVALRYEG